MSDYLVPAQMTVQAAAAALRARLELREGPSVEIKRTFYDTFDGLLREAGVSVRFQDGRLALLERDSGAERAWTASAEPARPLLAIELRDGPWRRALTAIVGVRALLAQVEIHSRVDGFDVLDAECKTVVRMTLEQHTVRACTGRSAELGPRLTLAGVRGYEEAMRRVRDTVAHELRFQPASRPLVDQALGAVGGAAGATSSKVRVSLRSQQRAGEAVATVLTALREVIEANLEGAIADIDSEFLHDLRVSVRRSRAVLRQCRVVFAPAEHGGAAHFRSELRWCQQVTGDARDLDVYVLEWGEYRAMLPAPMRRDLDPALKVLRRRRLVAHGEMVRALRSQRALALRADWASFLERLAGAPLKDRPAAVMPIGELAGERIETMYKRMVKMGKAIDSSSPPQDYHELRKKGKELRYLLELFAIPLYSSSDEVEIVKAMIKSLKALQDVLGRHQDRVVQVAALRSLRDEVSALPGGPGALMAMGALVVALRSDEQAARDEFAQRFAAFASRSQRKLVKEMFG